MAGKKKLTPEDVMQLSVRRMLVGALGKLGGAERLGELLAELGDNSPDMPSSVPESVRARVLTELARQLGVYGDRDDSGGLMDQETLDAFIASHEASRPSDESDDDELGDEGGGV